MTRTPQLPARAPRSRVRPARSALTILATTAVIALAACDANPGGTATAGGDAATGGLTPPSSLDAFVPSEKAGTAPDLPRVIGYAQLDTNEYDTDMLAGLEAGAADAELEVRAVVSDYDPQRQVQNVEQFLTSGVGSIVSVSLDPAAQAPGLIEAIEKGIDVQSVVFGPSTTQANVPQYKAGEALAKDAAEYIDAELGGQAKVVILNLDSVESIRPRYQAMRDVFGEMPGVQIVSDQQPAALDAESAFDTMSTILQKDPDVNVVLGDDFFALGALSAMEAARVDLSKVYVGGINASAEARKALESGGAYRATLSTSPIIMAYAMARQTGDWLDGRTVPQGICIQPLVLSSPEEVAEFSADMADLKAVYEDPERLSRYLTFQGEISYDTRDQWFNSAWAPDSCDQ